MFPAEVYGSGLHGMKARLRSMSQAAKCSDVSSLVLQGESSSSDLAKESNSETEGQWVVNHPASAHRLAGCTSPAYRAKPWLRSEGEQLETSNCGSHRWLQTSETQNRISELRRETRRFITSVWISGLNQSQCCRYKLPSRYHPSPLTPFFWFAVKTRCTGTRSRPIRCQ
jgi:hypothetical protein